MYRLQPEQKDRLVNGLWKRLYEATRATTRKKIVGLIRKLEDSPAEYDELFDQTIYELDDGIVDESFCVCEESEDYNFS